MSSEEIEQISAEMTSIATNVSPAVIDVMRSAIIRLQEFDETRFTDEMIEEYAKMFIDMFGVSDDDDVKKCFFEFTREIIRESKQSTDISDFVMNMANKFQNIITMIDRRKLLNVMREGINEIESSGGFSALVTSMTSVDGIPQISGNLSATPENEYQESQPTITYMLLPYVSPSTTNIPSITADISQSTIYITPPTTDISSPTTDVQSPTTDVSQSTTTDVSQSTTTDI